MAGGVRNESDRLRIAALRLAAVELGIQSRVTFVENADLNELVTRRNCVVSARVCATRFFYFF